jgi:hypothetical protein
MNFSRVIEADRLYFASSNQRVDSIVTAIDGSLGYYLQNVAPTSYIAAFCTNSSCAKVGETYPGYDGGVSLTACELKSAPVAIFNAADNLRTYDLTLSKNAGCYPIAGTVDFTLYAGASTAHTQCSLSSNKTSSQRIITEGIRFGSWLFNGSSVVSGLKSSSMVSTSTAERAMMYSSLCHLQCGAKMFGYTYCGYRDCSHASGDYAQKVTDCLAESQMRRVTYVLTAANGSCFEDEPALIPPKETMVQCSYVMPTSNAGIIGYFFASVGAVVGMAGLGFVYRYRRMPAIRSSQTVFMYIFLVGCVLMSLSIIVFVGRNTDFSCIARPWFFNISATTMFAPLLAKLHRVDVLLKAAKRMRKKKISDLQVTLQVVSAIAVDVVILVLWSGIRTPRAMLRKRTFLGVYEPVHEIVCTTDQGDLFEYIMIAWKGIMLAFGMWKAFQLRNAPPEYAESKQFAVVVYNIGALGGATYFLSMFGAPTTEIFVILRCLGVFVSATVSVVLLIFSKLMNIVEQGWKEDSKTEAKSSYSSSQMDRSASQAPRAASGANPRSEVESEYRNPLNVRSISVGSLGSSVISRKSFQVSKKVAVAADDTNDCDEVPKNIASDDAIDNKDNYVVEAFEEERNLNINHESASDEKLPKTISDEPTYAVAVGTSGNDDDDTDRCKTKVLNWSPDIPNP